MRGMGPSNRLFLQPILFLLKFRGVHKISSHYFGHCTATELAVSRPVPRQPRRNDSSHEHKIQDDSVQVPDV